MFKCGVCGQVSEARGERITLETREVPRPGGGTRTEIKRETLACPVCVNKTKEGTLGKKLREYGELGVE